MDTQDIIALAVVYAIIVVALTISLLNDKYGWGMDTRKIVHIGVGNFVFVWWAFSAQWIMLAFFAIPFEIILILAVLGDNPISKSKLGELSSDKGHKTGLVLYVLSIIIMIVCFFRGGIFGDHWTAASVGIVAMTYGDGFGSIVGRKFGKHKIIHGKSLEGSIGVFLVSAIMTAVIIIFYSWLSTQGLYGGPCDPDVPVALVAIVVGLITSVVEAVSPGEFDNTFIPLCTVGACILMGL